MPNPGNAFQKAIIETIRSWNIPHLHLYSEVAVGSRFVGSRRKIDLVAEYQGKTVGIECKTQQTSGTAYQKLSYTLEDAHKTPIPCIIVFSGHHIQPDVKAQLVSSGLGLEIEWSPEEGIGFGKDILKQRILIELGLPWLNDQINKRIF